MTGSADPNTDRPTADTADTADTAATTAKQRRLASIAVGLLCLALSAWASRDLGLTTDEPRYINNSQRLQQWFGDLVTRGPSIAFADEQLDHGWYWARTESKNLPLVSLIGSFGQYTLGLFDSPPHSHRWGNLLVLAITCGIVFSWIWEELSAQAAAVAVLALIGMPRLWTNAMLMSIDPLVASFQILACWALWQSHARVDSQGQTRWRWAIAFGTLAGVGAMAKPTFWLIVPAWIAWGLVTGPRRNAKAAACLVTVAPLAGLLLMPPWWSNPILGFLDYVRLLLDDPVGWKIDVYYLGHIFQAELVPGAQPVPVPWHSVPWLSIITTPPWILALVTIQVLGLTLNLLANGLARRSKTHRTTRRTHCPDDSNHPAPTALQGLWLIAALVLPLIVMLPSTPAHDGTRLYRPAFYFAAILAAAGFERIRQRLPARSLAPCGWTAVAAIAATTAWTSLSIHPAGLSYYNATVGGFTQAAQPVRQPRSLPVPRRPLYEVTYWWELFNRDAIDDMQSHLPHQARLTFFPEHYGRHLLKEWGHLRDDIQLVGTGEAEYMVMYARMGRLMDPRVHPSGARFLADQPDWELKVHDVRVAVLVKVNQK